MIVIRGGTFLMGGSKSIKHRPDNETEHQVTVSSFLMSPVDITTLDFKKFVDATKYQTHAERFKNALEGTEAGAYASARLTWKSHGMNSLPVVAVTWWDAVQYCNWRSKAEGLDAAYTISGTTVSMNRTANGYRLPTEAEWEYAAKGGAVKAILPGSSGLLFAGLAGDKLEQFRDPDNNPVLSQVGNSAPNELGLFDMCGLVEQWCWDNSGPYPTEPSSDPTGPAAGPSRILRGGSWYDGAFQCRVSARSDYYSPDTASDFIGFRVVRTASERE